MTSTTILEPDWAALGATVRAQGSLWVASAHGRGARCLSMQGLSQSTQALTGCLACKAAKEAANLDASAANMQPQPAHSTCLTASMLERALAPSRLALASTPLWRRYQRAGRAEGAAPR